MATAKRDLTDPRVQGPLLTIADARERLNVSVATVYRYMAKGYLPFTRVGGIRWVEERDVQACKEDRAAAQLGDIERARMQRRAAAHALHSVYDSRQITKPARDAFFRRFEVAVDPEGVLAPQERKRRAEQAKKAYFTDLARRSSGARASERTKSD